MNRTGRGRLPAAFVAAAFVLGGCGQGGESEPDPLAEGDEGTRTFRGSFSNVEDAPEGFGEVAGLAEMVVGNGRTTVDILVSGLALDTFYLATVNNDSCSASDPGGDLFKFDPEGGDEHPNVVKFDMGVLKDKDTNLAAGSNAEATYDDEAGPDAKSVVIAVKRKKGAKEDEADPPKLACADLQPAVEAEAEAEAEEDAAGAAESASPSPTADKAESSASAEEEGGSPGPSPKSNQSESPSPSKSRGSLS